MIDVPVECVPCDALGTVVCPLCHGVGCPDCDGFGDVDCGYCGGHGYTIVWIDPTTL